MNVHDEFTRRVAADRLCRELMRAIAENDTAALERLGMRGFGQYAGRLSELMTDSVRRELLGADDFAGTDFGAIMGEVAKPAHYAHHLVNEGGTAIQQALDKRQGIRLRVVEPEFNDGRLKGIVGEASESDSENAADNLAVQLGTMVKDMGNVFLKQNAEQRSRAGFKVTVTRTGGAKCCPWCADRTGKWELANAPDGVFGCHDNCKCVVDYTNSKGTVRGRAVTHKIDGKTVTKWEFADKIPYTPPKVLTREEAAARGGFDKPKRLTGGANGGIIDHIEFQTFYDGQSANDFFYYDTEERGLKARKDSSHSKWERGLSDDERSSIAGYAADEYQDINDYWRRVKGWEQINSDFVEQESRHIDSAIEKYEIKDNITVQRGVKEEFIDMLVERFDVQNDLSELVGKTFTEPGYSSTSALYGNPVATTKQVVIDIDVPSGKGRGAYINRLSGFRDKEYEFLIKRNASFTIREIKVEEQFGDYKYYMKVVMNNE